MVRFIYYVWFKFHNCLNEIKKLSGAILRGHGIFFGMKRLKSLHTKCDCLTFIFAGSIVCSGIIHSQAHAFISKDKYNYAFKFGRFFSSLMRLPWYFSQDNKQIHILDSDWKSSSLSFHCVIIILLFKTSS